MKILKTSEMCVRELSCGRWRRNTKGPAEHKTAGQIYVDELYKDGDGEGVQGNEEENANTGCGMVMGSNFRCLANSGKVGFHPIFNCH